MKIRGSVVSSSFVFPRPPEDNNDILYKKTIGLFIAAIAQQEE